MVENLSLVRGNEMSVHALRVYSYLTTATMRKSGKNIIRLLLTTKNTTLDNFRIQRVEAQYVLELAKFT